MKKSLLILSMSLLLTLFGCESKEENDNNTYDSKTSKSISSNSGSSNENGELITDEEYDMSQIDPMGAYTWTIEDIQNGDLSLDGLFLYQTSNDKVTEFYSTFGDPNDISQEYYGWEKYSNLDQCKNSPPDDSENNVDFSVESQSVDCNILQVDRSAGDQIIVISSSNETDTTLVHNAGFLGYGSDDGILTYGKKSYLVNSNNIDDIQELNGNDFYIMEMLNVYTCPIYILSNSQNNSVKYSYYEGTKYTTKDLTLNKPYYYQYTDSSQSTEIPVNKTQNGYFVIDVSTLNPGMYVIDRFRGSTEKYLVEIK